MSGPVIAVAGASGAVGRAVTRELVRLGHRPRTLVRPGSPNRAPDADVVECNLTDRASTLNALRGVDRLFMLTPFHPEQLVLQRNLISASGEAGVSRVVKLSALGAQRGAESSIHHQHGVGDDELRAAGMPHAVLRPNAFMQNALQWLPTIRARDAIVLPVGAARVSMIDVEDIGLAAASLLTADAATGGYDLTGPEALDYREVAEILSEVAGRPIRHVDAAPTEVATAMRSAGVPDWAVAARLQLYATYRAGEAEVVTTAIADITGRPPRDYRSFAAGLAEQLRN
ncbi:SDR family oxidoreductase [Saccharopolyspora shandongensis]|uniref:SDR family oxidoreductase n=1 Tax=Saccharopolyspora shandongensis TaxID=418495 RepID=UPI00340DFFF7